MEVERENEDSAHLHLDTVRALHQTVVSLRTALENSKAELEVLKTKFNKLHSCQQHLHIIEKLHSENRDLHEKINSLENIEEKSPDAQEVNVPSLDETLESLPTVIELKDRLKFQKKIEVTSKFDVKIQVSSKYVDQSLSNSESSDITLTEENDIDIKNIGEINSSLAGKSKDSCQFSFEKDLNTVIVETVSKDKIKMGSENDEYKIEVKITSSENLTLEDQENKTELDFEDLTLKSGLEEPDQSSSSLSNIGVQSNDSENPREQESDNESEEVDDIELIFTTDETKDIKEFQEEDLVSIRESEWSPLPNTSTPILVKFKTLDSEFSSNIKELEVENSDYGEVYKVPKKVSLLKIKRTSLPNVQEIQKSDNVKLMLPESEQLKLYNIKSDGMLNKKRKDYKSLDSTESLGLKSSSFDAGSSYQTLDRDESVDSFNQIGRLAVLPDADLTRCGISQENIAGNLCARRYTSPNPLFFRQPAILVPQSRRRESSVQTKYVPPPPCRWTSDGSLAHKAGLSGTVTTLPNKLHPTSFSRRTTHKTERTRQNDEHRRLLLSDIGFTSRIPELSRSAEPLWALAQQQSGTNMKNGLTYSDTSRNIESNRMCCDKTAKKSNPFCGSLPELRKASSVLIDKNDICDGQHTPRLLRDATVFLARSLDALYRDQDEETTLEIASNRGHPFIPSDARQLKLGNIAKVIAPHGQIVVGKVRYIGPVIDKNETHIGIISKWIQSSERARTLCSSDNALLVPFHKVVMAWEI